MMPIIIITNTVSKSVGERETRLAPGLT